MFCKTGSRKQTKEDRTKLENREGEGGGETNDDTNKVGSNGRKKSTE